MDSEHLKNINKSLHGIHQGQAKLWDHITNTSGNLSDQTTRRFQKVCKLIKSFEDTFCFTTNDNIQKLLVKVNQIATDVEYLKREIVSRVPLASLKDNDRTKTKRLTYSSSDTDSQENARDDNHEEDSDIQNEYDSSKLSLPADGMHSHLKKTSLLSDRPPHQEGENIIHTSSQISDLEVDGNTSAVRTNNLDTGFENNANRSGSESEEDNETVDPVAETHNTTSVKATVKRVKRNEFGFKRKLDSPPTDNRIDNRVAFHHRQYCYEGSVDHPCAEQEASTEDLSPQSWNISLPYLKDNQRKSDSGKNSDQDVTEEYGEYGIDNFDKPRTMKEWHDYAEQLRTNSLAKVTSECVKRGRHGHDAILVLDCSERMKGRKFEALKTAAIEYVNGIKVVQTQRGLEDNIGLAVFGGHSTLILESTSDYDRVKTTIDSLQPAGDAPLLGGLLLGLAGVLGGAASQVLQYDVPGHMIVFTDSTSDKEWSGLKDTDINPSYLTGDFRMEPVGVIEKIAGHSIKIYYVPIEETQGNSIMEQAVKETHGKVIRKDELYRLIRMTQVLILAAQVATSLRQERCNPTREMVKQSIIQKSGNSADAHEDCVDLVTEFMDPLLIEKRKGLFSELTCKYLTLGDRVRRGKNWLFEDQDSNGPGTVVGQNRLDQIWVEWDNSHVNVYQYSEIGISSIRKVNEPRDMSSGYIQTGFRVSRGPDWCYGDDDGGAGSVGIVLSVKPDGSAVVRWECSLLGVYRMGRGFDGLCEVQISLQSLTGSTTDSFKSQQSFAEPNPAHTGSSAMADMENKYEKDHLKAYENPHLHSTRTGKNINLPTEFNEENKFDFDHSNRRFIDEQSVNAVWEYKTDSGWEEFYQGLSDKIEKAHQKKKDKTILSEGEKRCIIDFKSMVKIDQMTKEKVEIRRKDTSHCS